MVSVTVAVVGVVLVIVAVDGAVSVTAVGVTVIAVDGAVLVGVVVIVAEAVVVVVSVIAEVDGVVLMTEENHSVGVIGLETREEEVALEGVEVVSTGVLRKEDRIRK